MRSKQAAFFSIAYPVPTYVRRFAIKGNNVTYLDYVIFLLVQTTFSPNWRSLKP